METERRNRAAQEAAAVEADRQRQASAQAEANRQAQASRIEADRQRQASAQAEANRQAQAAREAADRQQRQQALARQMEEQQQQEDASRQRAGIETLAPPPPSLPRTGITTIAPPTGALTPAQAEVQASGIQEQQRAYQDMLARAQAADAARAPALPTTPAPSIGIRDQSDSLLPPERDRTSTVSIGYGPGQVDPTLARAADVREGQPAFGQTTGPSTIETLYGVGNILDLAPAPENLTDLTLATGRFADTQQLLQARPDLVLPPSPQQTVMGTGMAPAGTPPRDIYITDEVQTLIEASPQARTVYQDLGIRSVPVFDAATGAPSGLSYFDQTGNRLSAQQVTAALQSAPTTTLPGGYTAIAPVGATMPVAPVIDLGLTPVELALPVTTAPGGGGGVSRPLAPTPSGIESLMDRSPTLGRPAATTVPQAADIVMPATDTAVTPSRPSELTPPEEDVAPTVDITVPEAEEGVAVDVETPAPTEEELVEAGWGWDRNNDGEVSLGERLSDMLDGGGKGQSGDQFEGGGVLSDIGNFLGGPGTGEGEGEGAGTGSGSGGGDEPPVEVEIPDEDAAPEQAPVAEEEPSFECPPGFRRVQMANGGFTCVPEMVRPRVGPYTQPVSVAPLAGRTPFRPGTRRT